MPGIKSTQKKPYNKRLKIKWLWIFNKRHQSWESLERFSKTMLHEYIQTFYKEYHRVRIHTIQTTHTRTHTVTRLASVRTKCADYISDLIHSVLYAANWEDGTMSTQDLLMHVLTVILPFFKASPAEGAVLCTTLMGLTFLLCFFTPITNQDIFFMTIHIHS